MDLPIAIKCEEIDDKCDDTIIDICDVNNEINTQESNKIKKKLVISPELFSLASYYIQQREQYEQREQQNMLQITCDENMTITKCCMKIGKPIWLSLLIAMIVLFIMEYDLVAGMICIILVVYALYLHHIYVNAIEPHT